MQIYTHDSFSLFFFNGASVSLSQAWETLTVLNLFTDASNLGFGPDWFYHAWSVNLRVFHITIKE